MPKKKPFTEEQEERIKDIAEGKAYAQNQNHVRWSLAHDYRRWLLFMALAVFIGLLSYHAYLDNTIDTDQLKAEIYQDLGYEKVCVEQDCGLPRESWQNFLDCAYVNASNDEWRARCWKHFLTCNCIEWQWKPKENLTRFGDGTILAEDYIQRSPL